MSCYIHGDGTFDLKFHAVVWGGGNLYNLDEVESVKIWIKVTPFYGTIIENPWQATSNFHKRRTLRWSFLSSRKAVLVGPHWDVKSFNV